MLFYAPKTFTGGRGIQKWQSTFGIGSTTASWMLGGDRGISLFLNLKGIHFCIYDIEPPSEKRRGITYIRGDACKLPFKTKSFDVVCSIATLPQILKELRPEFLRELKRVGKKVCLYSEAVQDKEGFYKGLEWESKFHKDVMKREHMAVYDTQRLDRRRVELDEIMEGLEPDHVAGCQNFDITYKYMSLSWRPVIGFFTGLMYYFVWKKKDNMSPYRSVIAVVENDSRDGKRFKATSRKNLKENVLLSGDDLQQ